MAQWLGQYTGNTHATKIEDLENSLRHAAKVFQETRSAKKRKLKAKAVLNLAKKLLSARLRLLKARLVANTPLVGDEAGPQMRSVKSLRDREAKARTESLQGILLEFSVEDVIS